MQAKLSCRNNDDLLHQKIPISEMPEFSSAIAAAGDDDRSADRYVKLAKEQRDYLRKQRDKDIHRKKVKKRVTITASLLAIALLISGAAFVGVKYYQSERMLKYILVENGYSVAAGKFYKSATIEIPHTVDGKPITVISAGAFKDNTTAETVIIPSSVTTIEDEAFSGCTNLKTIIFKPETQTDIFPSNDSQANKNVQLKFGLISIGNRAFYGCSGLTSITIPDSVTIIGEEAFCGCSSLESITLPFVGSTLTGTSNTHFGYIFGAGSYSDNYSFVPASLKNVVITKATSIAEHAFYGCTGLTSIMIPDSITSIGDYAFAVCTEIAEITIPKSVTSIGSQIFFKASSLKTVYYNSSYASPTNLFMDNGSIEKIVFGCETINANICPKSIKTVELTDAVKAVGDNAFNGCTSMTSITIPDSVTSISKSAFADTFLKNVKLTGDDANFAFENSILYIKDYSKIIYIFGDAEEITLPDAMTHVPDSLFKGYKNLKKITIPDSVTSIGKYAFYDCSGLTSITIPDSVTSIDSRAFSYCTGLTSITIPDGVTSIGEDAFLGCVSLESITLPFVGNTPAGTSNTHFGYIFGTSSPSYYDQFVPASLKKVVITKATSIGNDAFRGCVGLTSIEIPDSVTSIGRMAFSNCTGLTSITVNSGNTVYHSQGNCLIDTKNKVLIAGCKTSVIPADGSVTKIGDWAFDGCEGLTSITIPDSVTSIGDFAFSGTGLTSVTIPDSVTSIGAGTFYGSAYYFNESNWIDGVLYIGKYLVDASSNTISGHYAIKAGTKCIADNAFNGCTGLTSITIPDSVTSIGDDAFIGCDSLTSVTIGNGVTSIGDYAFYVCTGLTSITIGNGVTSIGDAAFRGCTGLTSITFKGTKAQWNAIVKNAYWNDNTGSYTIHCTDGDITKS